MRNRGFTLIELLAAMAVLAVVSVMAVQALGGVFAQRNVLGRVDDRSAALIRTLSALRQDLEASLALTVEPGRIVLTRGGIADLPGAPSEGIGSVRWALAEGALTRALDRDSLPETATYLPEVMLPGVTAFTLSPAGPTPDAMLPAGQLPPGFELILTTDALGEIRLVVAR